MSRVLIVDDKVENLVSLHALLSRHGHDVDTARHGAEALVKARQAPPDLVVSDLLMPVMDGYTFLRLCKADPLLRNTRFVVYTATDSVAEDEHLALSLGADAFILKPSEPEHFLSRIAEVQASESRTASAVHSADHVAPMQPYIDTMIRKLEEKILQLQECNRILLQELSEREQADRRIRYLNRVHAMASGVNALIVRAVNRDELFQEACRIAVEEGGFQLAMLGVVVPEGLDFVAMQGKSEEFLGAIRQSTSMRNGAPNNMATLALKERAARVSNSSQSDPQVGDREIHVSFGNHSMAMVPLLAGDEPVAVMALYATEGDFFHAGEIALLTGLAADVALAVEHLEERDRLEFLAYYDPLTGLANRSLFLERVGQHARSAARGNGQLAVLIFELERFKDINYRLGRAAGDDLLKQVAAWLIAHLGDADLLARIDADHFGVVFPSGEESSGIARVIEHMMADFRYHSFEMNGETLRLSARAGIAVFPADGDVADELFKRAEAALKEANSTGARYQFFSREMTDAVASRLELESQLRNAIENEEFVLHYQPKIDLRSGMLSGAEALIRWNNPRTGLVPPGLFIPILEETGMIIDVGRWAIQQAISDWLRWRRGGLPAVPIAVNVSPLQLRDEAFIAQLRQAIAVAEDAAQGLELEITESMIMEDVEQSTASITAIRQMGISVSINDFGTGFSSLGILSKLPIDTLKIERMLIVDMGASSAGLSLVTAMLTLARAMDLKVVAVGVETAEQARMLGLLNCDEIQGYLISPALACEDFEAGFLTAAWQMH